MPDILDGLSMNLEGANMDKLKSVFPECFAEGRLDIDKLLSLCGEYIDNDFEKYKFEWKGKAECLKLAQKRSTGTLRPCPEESVNFDETQNLYIEGDNLEVLKLLQTAYYRRVKMIYIDPPYNTGNDFVYADDFADPMARYKEVTQQTTKSNPETMGRFHTNWLNMMYPRLRLAANLLRDDGVIFISIDDNEVDNLKKICNEVFGEENFISQLIWQQRKGGDNDSRFIAVDHEYLLVYGKSLIDIKKMWRIAQTEEYLKRYKEEDAVGRYYWDTLARNGLQSPIVVEIEAPNGTKITINSQKSKETILSGLKDGTVKFTQTSSGWSLHHKVYMKTGQVLRSLLTNYGSNRSAADEITRLFGGTLFDYAKPTSLIKLILQLNTDDNDIILDFFSGSATTAHAVMQLNAEDGGNRRFILVQLPEVCDENSEAYKAGYQNICEIGKERIRRAGKKIVEEKADLLGLYRANSGDLNNQIAFASFTSSPDAVARQNEIMQTLDIGFKVFKLDTSNLKTWDGTPVGVEQMNLLVERMNGMIHRVKPDRSDMDMVSEIMLKLGVPLTYPVGRTELNGKAVYAVGADCLLLICLAPDIQPADVEAMAESAPAKLIISRESFTDDTAMATAHYILRDKGIELKLV